MTVRRLWLAGALLVMLASGLWRAAPVVDAQPWVPPPFTTLRAGGFNTITHQLPINVVFVGYEENAGPRDIKREDFLAQLSGTSCTRKRVPAFYGLNAATGLCFEFAYNVVFPDQAFEDALFVHLASLARPAPRTLYQDQYNEQVVRSLNVTQNHRIDAAAVEAWLGDHGADIGVNTSHDTVFFINWYGRSDFRFHVYDYRAEPEPDTGVDFGALDAHAMIAWGGSDLRRRVWFYDLSAGPERRTANWNLLDGDLNSNNVLDYRLPPVWEYGNLSGYRPFDDVSGDLGKVTRYVAVNLLFAASPLYDPAISPPLQPATIDVDINVFADSGPEPSNYLRPALIAQKISDLQPLQQFSVDVESFSLSGRAQAVYGCFVEGLLGGGDSCFGRRLFNITFGDLFLYFYRDHLLQYLEGDSDYEIPVFFFYSSTESPLDGFADDNWRDGTQTYAAVFNSDVFLEMGFGGTWTVIHEVGHHLGLSHPYDGYDYETDNDYSANRGDTFSFAGSGAQSRTVMNSIGNTSTFSSFDRDNMARYLTNIYINHTNRLLAAVLASPHASQTATALAAADASATDAVRRYQRFDYANAAARAKDAYEEMLAAAASIDVQIEPQTWQADYRAKGLSSKFIDSLDEGRLAR